MDQNKGLLPVLYSYKFLCQVLKSLLLCDVNCIDIHFFADNKFSESYGFRVLPAAG